MNMAFDEKLLCFGEEKRPLPLLLHDLCCKDPLNIY